MKVNPTVFCNSPWYELHIYWNGDFGFCCQQSSPPYDRTQSHPYNISRMSIQDWYNSKTMQESRLRMFGDDKWSNCSSCWAEEESGDTSRRHRANQKSVIFRNQFNQSLTQSPNFPAFEHSYYNQGDTDLLPVDLHIDLGNYCNLACKMCYAGASSTIATQEKKWGILDNEQYLKNDWTRDQKVWDKFLVDMETLPLKNVHFMGGETIMQPKFREFVDRMLTAGRTDLNISFVTNGTSFDAELVTKLTKFNRLGIEVSIETVTETNQYARQGTNTDTVLENIDQYLNYAETITLRPAISALTIRDFHTLLVYCLEKKLLMKASLVTNPVFLKTSVLPKEIRQEYKKNYQKLIITNSDIVDINESDPNNYKKVIAQYAHQAINLLDQEQTLGIAEMVEHMKKWDKVYKYDARKLYPELKEILDEHGY
jgi:sulfatase maturation enzyme AslB (radical SAM superfamily)